MKYFENVEDSSYVIWVFLYSILNIYRKKNTLNYNYPNNREKLSVKLILYIPLFSCIDAIMLINYKTYKKWS